MSDGGKKKRPVSYPQESGENTKKTGSPMEANPTKASIKAATKVRSGVRKKVGSGNPHLPSCFFMSFMV
jgi:hypothetical protein